MNDDSSPCAPVISTRVSRRQWLHGLVGFGAAAGWFRRLANATAGHPTRHRSCILLWMPGGPSQIDTFDPKPGHANGGLFKPIDTSVPGIQISEHLPQLSRLMQHVAVIRSMKTSEGDHLRATFSMRTGYPPVGPIQYPTMGSVISKELGESVAELPNFVSITPAAALSPAAYGPGFLGPQHSPLVVGASGVLFRQPNPTNVDQSLRVANLDPPQGITAGVADARLTLQQQFDEDFFATRGGVSVESHLKAYRQAVRMMRGNAREAFELSRERDPIRNSYGMNAFGQSCLLARRLVERGVPFVEISLQGVTGSQLLGWDTHGGNFPAVQSLCRVLDPAWATLVADLKDRGLLESTLIVWMGEFGRTPQINRNAGRDHFPNAWSAVLCGGGIRGGQVVGRTAEDGMQVVERPVSVGDLMATICTALGIDPRKQNVSNVGRPIRLADPSSQPIEEIVA